MLDDSPYYLWPNIEGRKVERFSADTLGTILEMGRAAVQGRITNISTQGFAFRGPPDFRVGIRVWLQLPGERNYAAKVIWCRREDSGCAFVRPISEEEVRAIAASAT
jgi:hypothetical protein